MHNSVEFILLHQDLSTVIGDNAFTKASRAPDCDEASSPRERSYALALAFGKNVRKP
jgi:hypothetical protein